MGADELWAAKICNPKTHFTGQWQRKVIIIYYENQFFSKIKKIQACLVALLWTGNKKMYFARNGLLLILEHFTVSGNVEMRQEH